MIYVIDGDLESLLCAIFEWFERKPGKVVLRTADSYQPEAFTKALFIHNDRDKADRVWKGLQKQLSAAWMRRFYCTFLSELPQALCSLFEFACLVFSAGPGIENNFGNADVLLIAQTAARVEREKHRMEAFIRFREGSDGIFYCGIDPDFNVLPLIMKHFRERYADQHWVIYDLRRHYGLHYDLQGLEEVFLNAEGEKALGKPDTALLSEQEGRYVLLWKSYFKSTNIAARKNTKLQMRHIPKRYWRYLAEF